MPPPPRPSADAGWRRRWRPRPTRPTPGPSETPESTTVAGPVRPDSAMSRTGLNWLDVKYWVMRLATWPRTTPATMATNMRSADVADSRAASGSPT